MERLRAILVDDENFTRMGLLKLIDWEGCGFRVVGEADNGEDALELIRRTSPDLVVTDIRMPVMDGLELIHRTAEKDGVPPAFIIVSGYDDFKYAQQAVRYGVHDFILKPIDEVEFAATLRKLSDRLAREKEERRRAESGLTGAAIEALILGESDDISEAEWRRKLSLAPGEGVRYALAELNDRHSWREPDVRTPTLAKFKERIREALRALPGSEEEERPFWLHEHRNRIGILITDRMLHPFGGDEGRFGAELRKALGELGDDTWLYVGSPVAQPTELRLSYETARQALQYKFAIEGGPVLVFGHLRGIDLLHTAVDAELIGRIVEQIEEQGPGRIEDAVDRLFRYIRERRFAPEAVKMCIQQCAIALIRTIRNMEGDENGLASLKPIVGWYDLHLTPEELRRLLTNFARESAALIEKLRGEQAMGGIQKIKAYIDAHYRENINLKSIATRFYLNPAYLGQLFKKTYGVYFNDYLLLLRIQEAKKLLRQTDLRIYEVAERVGFGSADYFVTQFEKQEGMTPTEYRGRLTRHGRRADA